jgi:hypothetical protein
MTSFHPSSRALVPAPSTARGRESEGSVTFSSPFIPSQIWGGAGDRRCGKTCGPFSPSPPPPRPAPALAKRGYAGRGELVNSQRGDDKQIALPGRPGGRIERRKANSLFPAVSVVARSKRRIAFYHKMSINGYGNLFRNPSFTLLEKPLFQ